ncbi:tafazzin-like [Styela clava]|uniref:tafazzin-like n=1 Tax=Styela clava TaxID=7725 RepID=UPI001939DE1C|nr:tafazzin-like [Styela clava]
MTEQIKPSWPIPADTSRYKFVWRYSSAAAISTVGMLTKIWLCKFNNVKIFMESTLHDVINKRPQNTALITVSNHYSCIDDPLLWGCLRWKAFFQPKNMRWSMGAYDICFTNKLYGWFFGLGKVIPVVRGGGIYQQGMDFMLNKLNEGQWMHIFPEGRVNMTKEFIRLKWGVGRLVSECEQSVIVLPFYHVGMDDILPNRRPYIPRVGKKVTILIGSPMVFDSHIDTWKKMGWTKENIRKEITDKIQEELGKLKVKAYSLHFGNESS